MRFCFSKIKLIIVLIAMGVLFPAISNANGFKFDAQVEIVSLYNFRAIDYGNSPAIQPKMQVFYNNLEFFAWGSQALIAREMFEGEKVPFNEVDWGFKYHIETAIGKFIPVITAYYCPFEKKKFFDLRGLDNWQKRGSQTVNVAFDYIVSPTMPIKLTVDYCFHNDPQKPIYAELGYTFTHDNYIIEPYLGVAKGLGPGGETRQYGINNNEIGFCNLGLNITKNIPVTDKFTLPVTSTLSIQPYTEEVWVVFKVKL